MAGSHESAHGAHRQKMEGDTTCIEVDGRRRRDPRAKKKKKLGCSHPLLCPPGLMCDMCDTCATWPGCLGSSSSICLTTCAGRAWLEGRSGSSRAPALQRMPRSNNTATLPPSSHQCVFLVLTLPPHPTPPLLQMLHTRPDIHKQVLAAAREAATAAGGKHYGGRGGASKRAYDNALPKNGEFIACLLNVGALLLACCARCASTCPGVLLLLAASLATAGGLFCCPELALLHPATMHKQAQRLTF